MDELVKSIDALSREQFRALVTTIGLQHLQVIINSLLYIYSRHVRLDCRGSSATPSSPPSVCSTCRHATICACCATMY